ncbi:6836_t:CDS:2, partial [Scutellospora calospora]
TPNLIPQQVSPNLIPQQVSPNLMPQQVTPNVIPQQVTPKAPEDISSPNSNFSHQGSIKSISSQDYQRPLTSGPGDLRRQSSTPIIGSGSSQPIIQGPGDARRHSVKQSPRHRSPLSNNNISQFNDSPMDDFSRSNTVRTTSSSASNSIGIQLDARGRVKQDDMAEAFFENSRYASPNQQQIRPVGPPYNNTISSNAFSYGRGIPATHMPAQNSPVMNNRLPSSGTSATIVNNNPQLRTQYPQQQVYSNTGFYNVPYDPRRPPPQQQQPYNVYMGHQRPSNGLSVQRMDDGRQVLFLVKALYDYKTTSVEEISFLASDVIAVLGTNPDGWWEGELLDDSRKKRGLFP